MAKAQDAFRTISEVADELAVQKHVLRFWENKFTQIRPMKRGGGRRFYRPDDLDLLRGIRYLLHREGYTIKGVQKILREQGPEHVKACWQMGAGMAAQAVPEEKPGAAQVPADRAAGTNTLRTRATRSAAKNAPQVDLVTQLDTIVEALEAAQSILRGKPLPRRALAQRAPLPTSVGKSSAGKASLQKKARGR
jgi:DNA-binding transcriptional MerR regulator